MKLLALRKKGLLRLREKGWGLFVLAVFFAVVLAPCRLYAERAEPKRPNVILFLVDDMGWMDCQPYGSQYYQTPNMQQLAEEGMLFTEAYSANPLCSPTRVSIMTGKYPARVGITTAAGHRPPLAADAPRYPEKGAPTRAILLPESRRYLDPNEYTLAEALRDAGYRTAHLGKWHLGLQPEHWPERQGFEVSFHGAPDPGPPSYHVPYGFAAGTVTDGPAGEYITDRVTDEAIRFIEARQGEPFFLNLWHYGVHGPWGHKKAITERFVGRKDPRGEQANPIMASMLKSIDESLGRVLDKLDELELTERTILIFSSDNGGNVHSNTRLDTRRTRIKPGHRRWAQMEDYRHYADYLPPTNNHPLREGKGSLYEGGVRVPLIVRWPGVVDAGSRSEVIAISIDFYPTILDLVGITPRSGQIFDGVSLAPVLKQEGRPEREAVFNYFPHGAGRRPPGVTVRKGDWKLIRWFETNEFRPLRHELYNLKDDLGETTNLASQEPQLVAELDGLIDRFLADTHAMVPIANPAYDPATRPQAGWIRVGSCRLKLADGRLQITTHEGRVQAHTRDVPEVQGPLVLRVRMRSSDAAQGIVYWGTTTESQYARERRVDFQAQPDGEWHEYEIGFTTDDTLTGIRFDPSTRPGTVELDWVRLFDADGRMVKQWEFDE